MVRGVNMTRAEKLEELEDRLKTAVDLLDTNSDGDELLTNILLEIKKNVAAAKKVPRKCMSNLFASLDIAALENMDDVLTNPNFERATTMLSKTVYSIHYKNIQEYEEIYKQAKQVMEVSMLYALTLQYYKTTSMDRAQIKEDIKETIKEMAKNEGREEAARMQI